MPKGDKGTVQQLERDLKEAKTTSEVKLVAAKAEALEKIQKLKK